MERGPAAEPVNASPLCWLPGISTHTTPEGIRPGNSPVRVIVDRASDLLSPKRAVSWRFRFPGVAVGERSLVCVLGESDSLSWTSRTGLSQAVDVGATRPTDSQPFPRRLAEPPRLH